jgi:hypothetical protein
LTSSRVAAARRARSAALAKATATRRELIRAKETSARGIDERATLRRDAEKAEASAARAVDAAKRDAIASAAKAADAEKEAKARSPYTGPHTTASAW